MSYRIAILYGSVRSERQGIKAARFIEKEAIKRNYNVTLLDPLEYNLPLIDKMYKEYEPGTAPENIEKIAGILKAADGFILVSGEYNHSVPPALKNMLDHFQKEYYFKPSALMTYSAGGFGGVRAAIHLRSITSELGMPSIPSVLPVPKIGSAFNEDGEPEDEAYFKRSKRFLDEFEWYMEALKNQREKGTPH